MDFKNSKKPLRICPNYNEIIEIFQTIKSQNSTLMMWQNKIYERVKTEVYISRIDTINKTITTKPTTQDNFKFSKSFTIYLYRDDISLLFKTTNNSISNNTIILNIPSDIRLLEKRKYPRIKLTKDKNVATIQKTQGYKKQQKNYKFQIIDVSRTGIALIVYSHELSLFNKSSEVILNQINDNYLDEPITGSVAYFKKIKSKVTGSNIFRVGINFTNKMSYNELLFISKS
jgi:c-di-GMP-binding flagellar brake protein YcgR